MEAADICSEVSCLEINKAFLFSTWKEFYINNLVQITFRIWEEFMWKVI